jgi:lysophospholipase L1-like esterase
MQAKNGLAALVRTRGWLLGCCTTVALATAGLVLAPAVASAQTTTYLALGDSISFGYSQERFNVNYPTESPAFFEEGFDHWFRNDLAKSSEVGKGVVDVNEACPGETSNGLIGENELLGGQKSTEPEGGEGGIQGPGDWHPCAYHNLDGLPLHTSLGTHSQLEEALALLKEGAPAHPVEAITLNIGSNDELAAIAQCKKEVTEEFEKEGKSQYGETPEGAFEKCVIDTASTKTFPRILENIGKIIGAIDSQEPGGGHYTGAIVLLGFYNPDSLVLPSSDLLQEELNKLVEEKILPIFPNVTFANPFPVFNKGNTAEKEQASICKYTEMCNPNVQVKGGSPAGKDGDIHPSLTGYKELAKLVNAAWLANPAK